MNRHAELFAIAAREQLRPERFEQLASITLPYPTATAGQTGLQRMLHAVAILALVAAVGVLLAAAWPKLSASTRLFATELGLVACLAVGWLRTHWRHIALAAALVLQGLLLFVFGRSLDTVPGNDWAICGLWTVLGLPIALAARSRLTWLLWTFLAQTAIAFWLGEHITAGLTWAGGISWGSAMSGWLASFALTAALARLSSSRRWMGVHGHNAFQVSAWCSIVLVTATSLLTLITTGPQPVYVLGLIAVALCWFALERTHMGKPDLIGLCAAALDTLLLCWLVAGLLDRIDDLGTLVMLGFFSAIIITLSLYLARGSHRRMQRRTKRGASR